MRQAVSAIRAELAAGPVDPQAQARRLREARVQLDEGLASVRDAHARDRSARQTLAHTLISAQTAVAAATDYVAARRGGVGQQARCPRPGSLGPPDPRPHPDLRADGRRCGHRLRG
ncbi:hypothetical protein I2V20_04175, partial [Rothia kristinae]|nr:hypothetical protein [Rothia kristinae]